MSVSRNVIILVRSCNKSLISLSKQKYYHVHRHHYLPSRTCTRTRPNIYRMLSSNRSTSSSTKPNPSTQKNVNEWRIMPQIRDIRRWDKYEWIYTAASLVQFLGFLSYDPIILRAFSFTSAAGLMVAHTGRKFFVGWFWAFSFAFANGIALYVFLREKYSWDVSSLTEEESFIYSAFFEPFGIAPLEYKQIIRIGHFINMNRGETLTLSGLICDKVFLLLSGQCVVINDNSEAIGTISGGHKKSFVGEIALIDDTQDEATATVRTNSETSRLLYWNVNELKHLLKNSKAEFRVKLINVFTASMKVKLLDLNANIDVEKSIAFKQQNFETLVQMLLISKGKLRIKDSDNIEHINAKALVIEERDMVELHVDEELFLDEYIKQKQISQHFARQLMKKYHIDIDLSGISI
eukprot:430702_1